LASNLVDNRRYKEGLELWRQVLRANPDNHWACAEAMYNIAKLSPESDKEDLLRDLIREYPDQVQWCLNAYDEISAYYGEKGDIEKSIGISYEAIKQHPEHGSVPSRLLGIYHTLNRNQEYEKAKEVKERLLREYPNSYDASTLDTNKKQ
jgi:tetratricopeptide (TPR) repeat protein